MNDSELIVDTFPSQLIAAEISFTPANDKGNSNIILHEVDKTLKYLSVDGFGSITLEVKENNTTIIISDFKYREPVYSTPSDNDNGLPVWECLPTINVILTGGDSERSESSYGNTHTIFNPPDNIKFIIMVPPPNPLIINAQAVSGITGSISIACWIIVFAPQIYQNFVRKSAEGLSLMFVILWLLGDFFNVIGAVMQGVLPTMIVLAIYYTLADIVLLWQCLVYGHGKPADVDPIHLSPANPLSTEHEPLLEAVVSNENRRAVDYDSSDEVGSFNDIDGNTAVADKEEKNRELFYNVLMVVLVVLAGFGGWWFGDGRKENAEPPRDEDLSAANLVEL
ncbi:unnamed protein product [Ambrosiozyma monospora]|uniref:Unnamed protein product n=1 Tax=Ambrosiozyma monospora TaxID=43982 RepID=A0ACB5TBL3_AMBMO|nr:unnamed protein product [Ambrosiozyma monospora]